MPGSDVLRSIRFFSDVLEPSELDILVDLSQPERFERSHVLIREDDIGHSMFVIVSGTVDVTVAGEEEPIATLKEGDIVGEMSLLTGARRSATVTATTPVEAIEISKEALAVVLGRSPDLVERFARMLARRQRVLDRHFGGGAWGLLRLHSSDLADTIRSFFGRAP